MEKKPKAKIKKPEQLYILGDGDKVCRMCLKGDDGSDLRYAVAFASEASAQAFVQTYIAKNTTCLVIDKVAISSVFDMLAKSGIELVYEPQFFGTKLLNGPITLEDFEPDGGLS